MSAPARRISIPARSTGSTGRYASSWRSNRLRRAPSTLSIPPRIESVIRSVWTRCGRWTIDVTRALLITNPAAARTEDVAVRAVVETLERGGWQVELCATGGPGDARRLAEQAVVDRMDVVTVFGGDGTTMQAAAALVVTDVALGVVPGGTGNLLAGNLRIPASPARAAEVLVAGRPRPFDLGRMERPGGPQYFAVACVAGYDARGRAATLAEHKRRWGMVAYAAPTLRLIGGIRSAPHIITIDGVEYGAHAAMVLVA